MLGVLFAGGRRVVASWIRAAGVSDDYQDYYHFLQSVGRRWRELGMRLLVLVLTRVLEDHERVLLAVDDSPTKRYGPKVQGAGIHHDPTPGPSGGEFCYGHVWVTLAVVVRHRLWGTIGLPLCAWLYVRAQDVLKLPQRFRWTFQTKLEQAADLVERAAKILLSHGKSVWCVADGAYAKRPFVRPLLLVDDLLRRLLLALHRVGGDDGPFEVQDLPQFPHGWNLVGFAIDADLPQTETLKLWLQSTPFRSPMSTSGGRSRIHGRIRRTPQRTGADLRGI